MTNDQDSPVGEMPQFEEVPPAKPLAPEDWPKLFRESAARPVENLQLPAEFVESQKKSIVSEAKAPMFEPPNWALRLLSKGATSQEVIEAAVKRALTARSGKALREVYAVLNELGRDPQFAAEIQKHITPENLAKLLGKE
jgi:hypothetical protein